MQHFKLFISAFAAARYRHIYAGAKQPAREAAMNASQENTPLSKDT